MARFNAAIVAKDGEGLRRYLQVIQKFPMLDAAEELELSRRWRNHQDGAAVDRLVTSHLRLVAKMALQHRGYRLPISDLISEGNVGMMHAVRRFDPEAGFRLASYARWWIRSSIHLYILQSWSLVKIGTNAAQKRLFFNLRRLESRMQAVGDSDLQRAQISQLADRLGVSEQAVVSMHRRLSGPDRSLDSLLHPDDVGNWEPSLVSVNDPENAIGERDEIAVRKTALPMALSTLNERQRHILVERRLKETPAKLEELAAHYRVSAERVRQIEVHALEKLRHSMRQQMSPPVEARARLDCARNGRRVVS